MNRNRKRSIFTHRDYRFRPRPHLRANQNVWKANEIICACWERDDLELMARHEAIRDVFIRLERR